MVVAGYLIFNTNMRIKERNGAPRFVGSQSGPTVHEMVSMNSVKERAEIAFQLAPEKMKNLVIVNSHLHPIEMIQACVEVAEKYAENVMVIPPLLARLTYAFEFSPEFCTRSKNECILVVTITSEFIDFVILRCDQNFELYIAEYECFEPHQYKNMFERFYREYRPHSTIFVVHKSLKFVAEELQQEFNLPHSFVRVRSYEKWDYVLLYGALLRAMDDEHGFDTRYHIANFSSGYETKVYNSTTGIQERKVLLPERSLLPCNIYGYNGQPHMITISYSPQYYFTTQHLFKSRRASLTTISLSASTDQVIGYVDERGVPFLNQNENNARSFASSLLSEETFRRSSSSSSSSANNSSDSMRPLEITFLFYERFYAVEVYQNGHADLLKDSAGNEWTPLYLSTVEGTEIGEKAKIHYDDYPRHVIYDVMKIIGKPMNEIEVDQKWGFELIDVDGVVGFEVQTRAGPRRIPQEIVIAAFFKVMKLQTQSELDTVINEIHVSTNFELNESQRNVFKEAAAKIDLQILSFVVRRFN